MKTFLLRLALVFCLSNLAALAIAISTFWPPACVYWFYSFPFAFLITLICWSHRRKNANSAR